MCLGATTQIPVKITGPDQEGLLFNVDEPIVKTVSEAPIFNQRVTEINAEGNILVPPGFVRLN